VKGERKRSKRICIAEGELKETEERERERREWKKSERRGEAE
jgi:hypothetical protein